MREEPTWRIPFGVLALVFALAAYSIAIAYYLAPWIAPQPGAVQLVIYIILGVVWLLPLRRFLIWMETGKWRA